MKQRMSIGKIGISFFAVSLSMGTGFISFASAQAAEVVHLTQVPCQFIEAENGTDQGYKSSSKAECEAINQKTAADRLEMSAPIHLKAGDYIFEVENKNVPYELGFWLREEDYNYLNPVHRLNKISVSGGGLSTGVTGKYEVSLKPGIYLYSCPLNSTPDYKLVVE